MIKAAFYGVSGESVAGLRTLLEDVIWIILFKN